jgi:nucleotide-binding universal stress UspA family protein
MAPSDVHTCPRCGLRFLTVAEMADHLRSDHGVELQPSAYRTRLPAPPEEPVPPVPQVRGVLTLPIDPTHAPTVAVQVAATLARQADLAVDLVAVRAAGVPATTTETYLAARAREASAAGAPVVSWRDLGDGEPATGILDHLRERGSSYLCMATRSRTSVGELVLGSVSESVLRRSPVPVVLVGPKVRPPAGDYRRLVVAVDGSEPSESAAHAAVALAPQLSAELSLLEVRDEEPLPEEERETAAARHLLDGLGTPPPRYEILLGRSPAREVVRYVDGLDGALIVAGTHGRTGLSRLAMGSVALDIVRHATCPVLVVPTTAARQGTAPEAQAGTR